MSHVLGQFVGCRAQWRQAKVSQAQHVSAANYSTLWAVREIGPAPGVEPVMAYREGRLRIEN